VCVRRRLKAAGTTPFPLREKAFFMAEPGWRQMRRLRRGYTTGTCAALAAKAAARMLLTGVAETETVLVTPCGERVAVPLRDVFIGDGVARCAVVKDAGDDPDVTDGVSVFASVRRCDTENSVMIDGGEGVGRVTRAGLDQPVGAAAINSVPRRMITDEVRAVCAELGYGGGISVVVSIPGGGVLAARTFNPRLGIEGGLSVIGTSGIVEPMSSRAVVDTLRVELNVIRASGAPGVILTPGNYGEAFLRSRPDLAARPRVKCSNFVGDALDAAAELGFAEALVVGHAGKLVKLSGGVMDTHSRVADCRLELLALHAALSGAPLPAVRRVLGAATADDGLDILGDARDAAVDALLARAESYCALRVGGRVATGIIAFSNRFGLLGRSAGAESIMKHWEE
jgi:cobalt-precorrin-5B (C1)-methyltransferase